MLATVEKLGLTKYDRMRAAIVEARAVDEVKDIRDKAKALEVYTAQARNYHAERQVAEIRVRAERRCGELLKEMKKRGERAVPPNSLRKGTKAPSSDAPTTGKPSTLDDLGITRDQASQWQKLAEIPEEDFEKALVVTAQGIQGKATTQGVIDAAAGVYVRGTFGSGENEWYTPPEYIEMAREVLGRFDLDPASSAKANQSVRAQCFYSAEDDGLKRNWAGKIWLNPPYAQPFIAQFIDRLVAFIDSGDVTEAILLTHNYTDTAWFHKAAAPMQAICFTRGRIGFLDINGNVAAPTQGQAFFYYGKSPQQFARVFCRTGLVMRNF